MLNREGTLYIYIYIFLFSCKDKGYFRTRAIIDATSKPQFKPFKIYWKRIFFYLKNLNQPKINKKNLLDCAIFAFDCAISKHKKIIYKK